MTSSDFEKLVIQHKDKLFRFAFSILKDSNDAQDAVQEVVLKLWKNKRLLDNAKNLESYCLNAVKNHCFDVLRKQKHHQNYLLTNVHESQEETRFDAVDLVEKMKRELPDHQSVLRQCGSTSPAGRDCGLLRVGLTTYSPAGQLLIWPFSCWWHS